MTSAADVFDLARFVDAQDARGTYERALGELARGRKTSHWMWFVFPQYAGLGSSATAQRYAIGSIAEARAYLAHLVLGPRLLECARGVAVAPARSADQLLGPVDAMKLRSSMTLFAAVADDPEPFTAVLAQWFGGATDPETTRRLG